MLGGSFNRILFSLDDASTGHRPPSCSAQQHQHHLRAAASPDPELPGSCSTSIRGRNGKGERSSACSALYTRCSWILHLSVLPNPLLHRCWPRFTPNRAPFAADGLNPRRIHSIRTGSSTLRRWPRSPSNQAPSAAAGLDPRRILSPSFLPGLYPLFPPTKSHCLELRRPRSGRVVSALLPPSLSFLRQEGEEAQRWREKRGGRNRGVGMGGTVDG